MSIEIKKQRGNNERNSRTSFPREEKRAKEALARQSEHDKLTPQQKLDKLDSKLKRGVGAKKERKRLMDMVKEMPSSVLISSVPVNKKAK